MGHNLARALLLLHGGVVDCIVENEEHRDDTADAASSWTDDAVA